MIRTALVAVVLFFALAPPAGTDTALRVLFIGNSYTFCNNLPALVEGMGRAAGIRIHTRMVAAAGSTLNGHWERDKARLAIQEGGWDWVVLQEQSSLGQPLLVNGIPRITGERRFHAAVRRFAEEIRRSGARMLLFLTWSALAAPEEQEHLNHAYLTIARETGASVAPAGMAWYTVRTENPEVNLYLRDGSHPSPAGSYLAASSVYTALTGRSPEGLPGECTNRAEARILQRAAWRASRQLAAAGGYIDFPAPAPPVLPEVPPGRRPDVSELAGTWEGELHLDRSPARMELHLTPSGDGWRARMNLFFDGGMPDRRTDAAGFAITREGVHFTDRSRPASRARFRGAFTGGTLEGTAEVITRQGSRTAVGSWKLQRKS